MLWGELRAGDDLNGVTVSRMHDVYRSECYLLRYECCGNVMSIVLSVDHPLLVDVSAMSDDGRQWVAQVLDGLCMPVTMDMLQPVQTLQPVQWLLQTDHAPREAVLRCLQSLQTVGDPKGLPVLCDPCKVDDTHYWMPMSMVNECLLRNQTLTCNGCLLLNAETAGIRDVRCVTVEGHRFEMNGLMHHNSVALRNVILHCLTHGNRVAIALIDLKLTEFSFYKGIKGVVAVANDVKEAAEVFRLGRECMYARNRELASLKLNDIKDFVPKHPTGEWMVFNHRMRGEDELEIRTKDGQVQKVKVQDLPSLF